MSRHEPPFTGVWPAMVTPFDAADRVNLRAVPALVARFIEERAGGLYVCGSSGGAPLLRTQERKDLAECVIAEVAGQIPVMVNVGHTSPSAALELARHAGQSGADAVSSTFPPFYSYRQAQVIDYWTSLSRASDLPFYGYVIGDLGMTMDALTSWVEALGRVPTLTGVKFTSLDTSQIALLKRISNDSLNVLSGYDQCFLSCRAQGADGAIGGTYNIALPMWVRVNELFESGDMRQATKLMSRCTEIVARLLSSYFMPVSRLVLKRQGIDCGRERPPLCEDVEISETVVDELVTLVTDWESELDPAGA